MWILRVSSVQCPTLQRKQLHHFSFCTWNSTGFHSFSKKTEDLMFLHEVIFCQPCTVYMKTFFPSQLAGPKMQVIKQRKIKNIFRWIELGAGVSV